MLLAALLARAENIVAHIACSVCPVLSQRCEIDIKSSTFWYGIEQGQGSSM
jgi:hypothetical protein